ncbi:MAG: iron complex outermembrane receptor protein, partial [Candidatus Azotimanducaceae bacterium]
MKQLTKLSLALATSIGLSTGAMAASNQIEEVTVTAQRTAESIQDVPIAVTALTGQMLLDKQVVTVSDLQMNAPNVSFTNTNFGSNSLSIRGIGRLLTAATGDAGVSVHTNEISIGPNLNSSEFYDMERVEILRGPQGTLYGKNATGGVVNFVTVKPTFDGVNGFLDVEVGDYNNQRVKGAVNIPIADNFAVRVAGMMLQRDGYSKN